VLAELDAVVAKDVAEFNAAVPKEEIPPVVVLPKKAGSGR
jgi:hypothetical protein